ncbi:DNA polymerase III subunit delta [Atopobium sp. oral taxon 810]|uniref:DNA polymerase III subunit delta n=1 Tax=Atopobium sp. oral taxon 810 TaxID=712158 RepID=UPI000395E3AF|nr:DNA polymerase III subunit delta [Atopobium sp. oral taxon 810]ERI03810.1 DNA polymerase III, delta subunit [Atopobium sp. oral taxon 810 str. F0209]
MPATKNSAMLVAYAAIGSDERKKKSVVDRLKKHLAAGMEAFNLDEINATSELDAATLLGSLNTLPFGADRRFVIVNAADRLDKTVKDMLVDYLSNPNGVCTLCLLFDSLPKNTRLYKAIASIGPKAIIDCVPKRNRALVAEVNKFAQARGMYIDGPAVDELIKRSGESGKLLENQVSQLCTLCRTQGHISYNDVVNNISQTAEIKPWDFLDPVCERNAVKALTQYHLMAKPSQIALLAMLVGRLRELICTQSLMARGQEYALASTLGKRDFQIDKYKRWVRNFAPGELSRFVRACADCDRALKSGADPDISFTQLILQICGAVQ